MQDIIRVYSCVPEQRWTFEEKLVQLEEHCTKAKAEGAQLVLMPQEYFGGYGQAGPGTTEVPAVHAGGLLPKLIELTKRLDLCLVVGVLEEILDRRHESMWIVDRGVECFCYKKTFLPRYSDRGRGGYYHATPGDLLARAQTATVLDGVKISVVFCWEAFSDLIWSLVAAGEPDLVLSPIKFGVAKDVEVTDGCISGFVDAPRMAEFWISRLHMAKNLQVRCPIVCSTSTWGLAPESAPLYGMTSPQGGGGIKRGEGWQVDEIDLSALRKWRASPASYMVIQQKMVQRQYELLQKMTR
jgi:predicted amidohydrolase